MAEQPTFPSPAALQSYRPTLSKRFGYPDPKDERLVRDEVDEAAVRFLERQSLDLSDGQVVHSFSTDNLIRLVSDAIREVG